MVKQVVRKMDNLFRLFKIVRKKCLQIARNNPTSSIAYNFKMIYFIGPVKIHQNKNFMMVVFKFRYAVDSNIIAS